MNLSVFTSEAGRGWLANMLASWWARLSGQALAGTRAQMRRRQTQRAAQGITTLATLLAAPACWWGYGQWQQAAALEEEVHQVAGNATSATIDPSAHLDSPNSRSAVPAPDFVERLPALPRVGEFMHSLEVAAKQADVRLVSAQVTPEHQRGSPDLQTVDLSLSLRGTYPGLKRTLGDILAQFPEATLSRMSLRSPTPGEEVEAVWQVKLWAQPHTAG